MIQINIESVVANAFIQVLDKFPNKRFLSYIDIKQYGLKVVSLLRNKGRKAVLGYSMNDFVNMFEVYSPFFEEKQKYGIKGIELCAGKSIEDLIKVFQSWMPLDILSVFLEVPVIKETGNLST